MKIYSLTAALLILTQFSFAQSNILNAKNVDEIGKKTQSEIQKDNDKPLDYGYVGDRDILMGRIVWEIIDLDERVNFPLYYPVEEDLGSDRIALFEVLARGMESGKITEVFADSYFTSKKTLKEIQNARVFIDTTNVGREQLFAEGKVDPQYIDEYKIEPYHVSDYKIKGMWYFDKRQGEMKYRLLGLCPVTPDVFTLNNPDAMEYIELFWVFYPNVRDELHKHKAFNERNPQMSLTFDHILNARRFNARIYKEQNVMADREVAAYMRENALNQLLEGDRIREKIRNFEIDMWNY